ncbi:MAG: U32 family peptidase [Bacteroidales bacterium]|nr:U32 family peptidase [Bacteroidales bacterium]
MQLRETEILAPAKNIDIGIAAINCGADALYIAGPSFGAREAAGNSIADVERVASYAHKFGAGVYMVLNTILFDNEIESAVKIAHQAYEAGCDALIIQDLGLLKAGLPPIPLFASTQTNVRTPQRARMLESLGFKRAILARELSLTQIEEIGKSTSMELETFIHGALCVSYSGQCYLSSRVTGRSGNRGECAQLCRSNYNLVDGKGEVIAANRPILSLKDLNLAHYIPQLMSAGVTSFKIEGRLKGEPYIKNVVRYYRSVMDRILEGQDIMAKRSSYGKLYGGFTPRPESTFNRGYTNLFIEGERGEWSSGESAGFKGEYIGEILSVGKDRRGSVNFRYKPAVALSNGDGLFIIAPDGTQTGIRASVAEGDVVYTNDNVKISAKSKIYRNYNHLFEKELESNMPERIIDVAVTFCCEEGVTNLTAVSEDGREVKIEYPNIYENAKDPALAKEGILRQLEKRSGIYRFTVKEIALYQSLFYPASVLNGMRREIASQLDSLPVAKRAEREAAARGEAPRGERVAADVAAERGDAASQKSVDGQSADRGQRPLEGMVADYRENISNSLSAKLYTQLGALKIEKAFELAPPAEAELMRCRYCIRKELDMCHKEGRGGRYSDPLWLENGGRRFRVEFDCNSCEMVIFG